MFLKIELKKKRKSRAKRGEGEKVFIALLFLIRQDI